MRWFIVAVLAVLLSCLPGSSRAAVNGANAIEAAAATENRIDANTAAAAEAGRAAEKLAAAKKAKLDAANAASETGAQASKAKEDALEDPLPQSAKVLLKLFVLAVILESALAILFNWRPFIATFDGRATKPLIALIVAFALVKSLNLDVVGSLVRTYTGYQGAAGDGWLTSLLTAMVIAGGSAGVNRMLRSLGYRSIDVEETKPKPPPTKAWVAAHRGRIALTGPLDVLVAKGEDGWKLAGSITGLGRLRSIGWLLRDRSSFPTAGGLAVDPDQDLRVALVRQGQTVPDEANIWGPRKLMAGAIVDIYWPLSRETPA
jgi:hypothetical protein